MDPDKATRPVIEIRPGATTVYRLGGDWTIRALSPRNNQIRKTLHSAPADTHWQLDDVSRFDSFGVTLLWHAWGRQWPEKISLSEEVKQRFASVADGKVDPLPSPPRFTPVGALLSLGGKVLGFQAHVFDFIRLTGQLSLDILHLMRHPTDWPLREFSANLFKVGVKAMPVAALVGFLIGIVLSYLSALQLRSFGADIFIVDVLGIGITRELGPILVAVLVAGRSGSAMTAQIGVMRVTQEIDALSAMGVSRSLRLVLPKVLALTLAMPLLVVWTSSVALYGGMVAAVVQLDMSIAFFIETLPQVVPVANLYIGVVKGVIFGFLIALVACHFGLRVRPNTDSLSANTTASVVSAITLVILVDAIIAIATRSVGMP